MFYPIAVAFLIVGGAFIVIAIQNFNSLQHLAFFVWQTPDLPLGLLVLLAFLCGALLLYIVSALSALRERSELRRLRRRVAELEQMSAAPMAPRSFPSGQAANIPSTGQMP